MESVSQMMDIAYCQTSKNIRKCSRTDNGMSKLRTATRTMALPEYTPDIPKSVLLKNGIEQCDAH